MSTLRTGNRIVQICLSLTCAHACSYMHIQIRTHVHSARRSRGFVQKNVPRLIYVSKTFDFPKSARAYHLSTPANGAEFCECRTVRGKFICSPIEDFTNSSRSRVVVVCAAISYATNTIFSSHRAINLIYLQNKKYVYNKRARRVKRSARACAPFKCERRFRASLPA